ncbi:hypothetical protein M3Y99_01679000 [Aphelenchoides fujianensis]|nr:hypothetical protein M3Y99_01679000 [Aphelenchoides fujianensis]
MLTKTGAPVWPPPLHFFVLLSPVLQVGVFAQERLMGGLISTRDIAEITQIATQLAAQTMNANGELLSKPGRPESRPVSLNSRPSEFFGQSLTNMMQPAAEQLARAFSAPTATAQAAPRLTPRAAPRTELPAAELPVEFGSNRQMAGGSANGMGGLLDLASSFLRPNERRRRRAALHRPTADADAQTARARSGPQLWLPAREKVRCLPFVGEFMQVIYGNCVKQADERTWDAWGKEITNALMGGKIDLLRARRNPMTVLEQVNGFINGEAAQGTSEQLPRQVAAAQWPHGANGLTAAVRERRKFQ